jgi:hypothetical protein
MNQGGSGRKQPDFDVALSFAGEDRRYVEQVAKILRDRKIRVFYDEFMLVDLWGEDLYSYFDDIYRRRARFAVVFVSENYARKAWTSHERQSAQARALIEQGTYLLPVRLDDSDLPGLRPTTGYVDARKIAPKDLADLIEQKTSSDRSETDSPPVPKLYGVPRDEREQQELVAARPSAWEYLLFASVLWQGKVGLEPKYRDHELRMGRGGPYLHSSDEVIAYVQRSLRTLEAEVSRINRLFSDAAQGWAFGPIGSPGDPENIVHLGNRFIGVYAYLLDWSAEVRSAAAPDEYLAVLDYLSECATLPIDQVRKFIDDYVAQAGQMSETLNRGEDVHVTLTLGINLMSPATDKFRREVKRLKRKRKW